MSKKVLVIECSAKFWVDILQKLKEEKDWYPVYWTTGTRYLSADDIHQVFPDTIVQDNYDSIRGVPAHVFEDNFILPAEIHFLQQFSYYESIVIKMMDRMDPLGVFTHAERVRLYHFYIKYWLHVLNTLKPDVFLTPCTPHLCYDFIVYQLCLYKKIRCIVFVETTIPHLFYINERFEMISSLLEKKYIELLLQQKSAVISDQAIQYLMKITGDYQQALPSYMVEQFATQAKRKERKPLLQKVGRDLRGKAGYIKNKYFAGWLREHVNVYYKAKDFNIEERTLNRDELRIYYQQMEKRTDNLQKKYLSLITPADFTKPYIFVALMYQPERTSSPDGGLFTYQYLMIEWLSACAPEDWTIYVKEHPSQFIFKVDNTRNSWMYDDLAKLRNVKLIDTETNTFELIDHSKAVASLTGTIGFEAVVRSKPVLCFGYAWYRGCEGVFDIQSIHQLKECIEKIINGFTIDKEKINKFVQALEETGINGYVDPYYEKGFDYEKNVNNIKEAIISFEERSY